jgi:hypothetical protein
MESIGLYTEARNEYLKQLSTWIVPPIVEFFRKEYGGLSAREGEGAMAAFQDYCSEVPRWNQDVIEKHINSVLDTCRCDYVEELMTAVFIAHTKVLTSVRVNTKQKKLQITLPKLDHFLHRVFTECARMFWKAPFLFAENLSYIERQKNILQAESMCTEGLSGAIRSLLPVKNILRDYLEDDEEEDTVPVAIKEVRGPKEDVVEEYEDEETQEALVVPVAPAPVAPAPVAAVVPTPPTIPDSPPEDVEETPKKSRKSPAVATTIEKIDAPPSLSEPIAHEHSVSLPPSTSTVALEKTENPNPPQLMIDTEPSVHFTPYDTVYDETVTGISEIRYAPKISVEDKPPSTWGMDDVGPSLTIGSETSNITDDVVDLEAPPAIDLSEVNSLDTSVASTPSLPIVRVAEPAPVVDIDMPLTETSDFVELA